MCKHISFYWDTLYVSEKECRCKLFYFVLRKHSTDNWDIILTISNLSILHVWHKIWYKNYNLHVSGMKGVVYPLLCYQHNVFFCFLFNVNICMHVWMCNLLRLPVETSFHHKIVCNMTSAMTEASSFLKLLPSRRPSRFLAWYETCDTRNAYRIDGETKCLISRLRNILQENVWHIILDGLLFFSLIVPFLYAVILKLHLLC